jgi:hypothetical protein
MRNTGIDDSEAVTRYILSEGHFSREKARVKARCLEPSPDDGCTSVFRIKALKEQDIWKTGNEFVAGPRGYRLYARADIVVAGILSLDLDIRPDEPPPRHAVIFKWPEEKAARIAKAQQLAALSTLVLNPQT